jgi:hypothetical protein
MGHAIAFPTFHGHTKAEIPLHRLIRSAALVTMVILLGLVAAPALKGYLVEAPAPEISLVRMTEVREAPATRPKDITFEHMFRANQPTPSFVSIRNSAVLPSQLRTSR